MPQKPEIPRPHWHKPEPPKPLWGRLLLGFLGFFSFLVPGGRTKASALRPAPYRVRVVGVDSSSSPRIDEALISEEINQQIIREREAAGTEAAPIRYTVQEGDTLWRIAEKIYGRGERWIDIWYANRSQISDADIIQANQTLAIFVPQGELRRPQTPEISGTSAPEGVQVSAFEREELRGRANHLTESLSNLAEIVQFRGGVELGVFVEEARTYAGALDDAATDTVFIDRAAALIDTAREAVEVVQNKNQSVESQVPTQIAQGVTTVDSVLLAHNVGSSIAVGGGVSVSPGAAPEIPAMGQALADIATSSPVFAGSVSAGEALGAVAMGVAAHVVFAHNVASSDIEQIQIVPSNTAQAQGSEALTGALQAVSEHGHTLITREVAQAAGVAATVAAGSAVQAVATEALASAVNTERLEMASTVSATGSPSTQGSSARAKATLPRLSPRFSHGSDNRPDIGSVLPTPSPGDVLGIIPSGTLPSGVNLDIFNPSVSVPGTTIPLAPLATLGLSIFLGDNNTTRIANAAVNAGLQITHTTLTPVVVGDMGISGAGLGPGFEGGVAAGGVAVGEGAAVGVMTGGEIVGAFLSPAGIIIIGGLIATVERLFSQGERTRAGRREIRYNNAVGMTRQMIYEMQNSSTPEELMLALRIGNTEDPTLVFREGYVTSPQIQSDNIEDFRRALEDLEHLDIRLSVGNLGARRDAGAMNTALTNTVRAQALLMRLANQGNAQAIGILQARRDEVRRIEAALRTLGPELSGPLLTTPTSNPGEVDIQSFIVGIPRLQAVREAIGRIVDGLSNPPARSVSDGDGYTMAPTRIEQLDLLSDTERAAWDETRNRDLPRVVDAYRITGGQPSELALRWLAGDPAIAVARTMNGGQQIPANALIGEDGTISVPDSEGPMAVGNIDPLPSLDQSRIPQMQPVPTLIDTAVIPSKVPQTSAVNPSFLVDHAIRVSGYQPTPEEAAAGLSLAMGWLGAGVSSDEVAARLIERGRTLAAARTPQTPQPAVTSEVAAEAAPGLVEAAIKASGYTPTAAERQEGERAARELLLQGISRGDIVARLTEIGRQRTGGVESAGGSPASVVISTPVVSPQDVASGSSAANQNQMTLESLNAQLQDTLTESETRAEYAKLERGEITRDQAIEALVRRGAPEDVARTAVNTALANFSAFLSTTTEADGVNARETEHIPELPLEATTFDAAPGISPVEAPPVVFGEKAEAPISSPEPSPPTIIEKTVETSLPSSSPELPPEPSLTPEPSPPPAPEPPQEEIKKI
ncbi:LysM peptidoglycan-binding domain-containing protein [Candidatus Wolfebacteria bacterium]|nr:LysM peptidoglycan-binding domain-containing protein [Candidatus Wolfebacteria bacterium]